MFIGHFGVAFAAKRAAPRVSLGTTILATCWLDAVWPLLVIAGIERVEIAPGITRMTPLDFVYYPWSHSLLFAIGWGIAFAVAYWLLRRSARAAILLGAIVVSHWVLDWVVHRPDLPLYPGEANRHGLGLWNEPVAALAIEAVLFAGGIYIYLTSSRSRDRIGIPAFWALVAVLLAAYLGAVFGPPPPSAQAVAYTSLIGYLMVAWGWWIDRHREPVTRPA
ncbi:MAG: metal-dependent hydrolase [Usitatibacter sp.]